MKTTEDAMEDGVDLAGDGVEPLVHPDLEPIEALVVRVEPPRHGVELTGDRVEALVVTLQPPVDRVETGIQLALELANFL
jgi:hypothetical protein